MHQKAGTGKRPRREDLWAEVCPSLAKVKHKGVTASQRFSSGATNKLSDDDREHAKAWITRKKALFE